MSTRSRIAAVYEDGSVHSIYCHSDGYIEGVGEILYKYYVSLEKVKELISLGDLSSLGITTQHSPDDWKTFHSGVDHCITYADRGESDVCGVTSVSEEAYINWLAKDWNQEEFFYLFKDGDWYVQNTRNFMPDKLLRDFF